MINYHLVTFVRCAESQVTSIPLSQSHNDPVYCCIWTASKTGTEVMTSSEDGMVMWWDVRQFDQPTSIIDVQGETFSSDQH